MWNKLLRAIIVGIILICVGIPVYAQVGLPDTQQINQVEVYRSVLELEDQLYLFSYNNEYTANPDLGINQTYVFRLMNGVVLLDTTTAYAFFDDGYDDGIASIYFSQADAPAWNGAYTVFFDGNPALHWLGDTATTAMVGVVAQDGVVLTDETAASNDAVANDMNLLPAAALVDDAYYFCSDRMFDRLTINIGTQGTPAYNPGVAGWLGAWEYYDGDSWETIAGLTDETIGFTVLGNADVYYPVPTPWHTTVIDGITGYWIRYRVIEFNTEVQQPLGTQSWTNTIDPPSVNTNTLTWIDEGTVADAQERLTTRLRYVATTLEQDWGGVWDLIEDTASGKVLTPLGEDYFTNSITNLRSMCPNLFFQQMRAAEFEHDILITDLLSTGNDAVVDVFGNNWFAQTFQPSERYDITGVNIPVFRTGNPGNITVSLRATAAGLPVGADLVAGTFDGNTVTTDAGGEWIAIAFTDDSTLTAGTTYAIVVRCLAGNAGNHINWQVDTDNGYANGQECTSVNAGVAWAAVAANDLLFEILARGGITARSGRVEGRLTGTGFDLGQIAVNWGTSTMWINAIMGIGMILSLCWAAAQATNSWDLTIIIVALCAAFGWRMGFIDTIFMALTLAIIAIGCVYAAFWKKAY